jgi:hypothetical protein
MCKYTLFLNNFKMDKRQPKMTKKREIRQSNFSFFLFLKTIIIRVFL